MQHNYPPSLPTVMTDWDRYLFVGQLLAFASGPQGDNFTMIPDCG